MEEEAPEKEAPEKEEEDGAIHDDDPSTSDFHGFEDCAGDRSGPTVLSPDTGIVDGCGATFSMEDLPSTPEPSEDDDVVSGRSDPTYGAADSSGRNSDSSTRVNPPESVYATAHAHPTAPERTSSILRREQQLYQVRISLQKFYLTYLESKLLGSANRVTKLDDKNL